MKLIESNKIARWVARKLAHASFLVALGGLFSVLPMPSVSSENSLDRIQAGSWVVASMYWEDKLVSTGKAFNPIGWHAAHKTLPIGTLIRVSNPRSVRREPRSGFESWCRHVARPAGARHRLPGSSVDSADQGSPSGCGKLVCGQRRQCCLRGCSALLASAPRASSICLARCGA